MVNNAWHIISCLYAGDTSLALSCNSLQKAAQQLPLSVDKLKGQYLGHVQYLGQGLRLFFLHIG